ncbi:A24 family peptidase [Alteribacillus iranensis]|uniref:Prepilin peptidase CpaA n=1 Tax=Alteribacillus iranensis TaxID=930128 RepID=A0A1I2EU57_9BACI|nr:prepilin peptidase [Alteribacillus iranensis]SFE96612.1 prepilin peptidase CpaA [Alteribacillus iranensis]
MNTIVLIILLTISVVTDIKTGKIYNKILFPAAIFGFIYHIATAGWEGLWQSFLGLLLGLGLLFIPYMLGGMGAGDVKLLAAVGALTGPAFVFQTFVFTALIGAVMAAGIILYRRGATKMMTGFLSGGSIVGREKKTTFPYGVAIAAGAVISLFTEGVLFL